MKKAKKQAAASRGEDWSAGDRIGKTSLNVVRDARVCAEIDERAPLETFVRFAEMLEDILDAARDVESTSMVVVEEIPDLLRRLNVDAEEAKKECSDAEAAHDEEIASVRKAGDEALAAHEEAMVDLAKTADRYRALMEKADHECGSLTVALEKAESRVEKAEREASADLARVQELRRMAEIEHRRLAAALASIVAGRPEDAHRAARIALGREALEASGTAAREGYIPTRRERRAAQK